MLWSKLRSRLAADWTSRVTGRAARPVVGTVAFNQKPVNGSWGGSNQFVVQMCTTLARWGYRVRFDLADEVDIVFLVDPRRGEAKPFGIEEIAEFKARYPRVRVLQRINECDSRKATDFMDSLLKESNRVADYTVFISAWLRDYHAARWFDTTRPHGVIYNGADPSIFFPDARPDGAPGRLRLVTHHWSANWLKGFDVYQKIDEMIADGELPDVDFTVIGRWPEEIQWRAAKTIGPMQGAPLAAMLRRNSAYVTASRWEPCGMHHVEGIQCGLPVIYHEEGGGIVEAAARCGVGFRDRIGDAVESMRGNLLQCRRKAVHMGLTGDRMALRYMEAIHALMFDERAEDAGYLMDTPASAR